MRIISETSVRQWARKWPETAAWLRGWIKAVAHANWRNLMQVRLDYPHADGVKVRSGKSVTVFNVCGNKFRLITGIHYNRGIVFTLLFLTHAEYSRDRWKESL